MYCHPNPTLPAADCADRDARVVHVGAVFADPGLARRAPGVAAGRQGHEVVV